MSVNRKVTVPLGRATMCCASSFSSSSTIALLLHSGLQKH
jgi:hypothetical protein